MGLRIGHHVDNLCHVEGRISEVSILRQIIWQAWSRCNIHDEFDASVIHEERAKVLILEEA